MDFDLATFEKMGMFLVFPAAAATYCLFYAALRLTGILRVGRDGWHAGGLVLGRRQFLPALRVFEFFHPPMRAEAALRRRLGRGAAARTEPGVSDVVVELVRMA